MDIINNLRNFIGGMPVRTENFEFNDETITTAVNLWFDNKDDAIRQYGDISTWNTKNVTSMSRLFENRTTFNDDISKWDVSNVTTMFSMFKNAELFNQDISYWNISKVTDLQYMFFKAYKFDADIRNWDIGNVSYLGGMFDYAYAFNAKFQNNNSDEMDIFIDRLYDDTIRTAVNLWFGDNRYEAIRTYGDISRWNVSKVTNMRSLFKDRINFNENISRWNVSNVTDMGDMFNNATYFDQPIGNWDVSNVKDMEGMFNNATFFDQPIGNWDVSGVTNMKSMFKNASSFNQSIGNWDVSNMIHNINMFEGANALPLSNQISLFNSVPTEPRNENIINNVFNTPNRNQTTINTPDRNQTTINTPDRNQTTINTPDRNQTTINTPDRNQNINQNENIFNTPNTSQNNVRTSTGRPRGPEMSSYFSGDSPVNTIPEMNLMNQFNDLDYPEGTYTIGRPDFPARTDTIRRPDFPARTDTIRRPDFPARTDTIRRPEMNLMNRFNDIDEEVCPLSDTPIVGNYYEVKNIVTEDPSNSDDKEYIIYNKSIRGIYMEENIIRILNADFKKTDQHIYPNPKNGATYKLINKYDYLKDEHVRFISSKLKMNENETIVKYPRDWQIHTSPKIHIRYINKIPIYTDFIKYFINQSKINNGQTMYSLPLFLFTFEGQQGLDYGGLFTSFLSDFVTSISANMNYLTKNNDSCLFFNKAFSNYNIIDNNIITESDVTNFIKKNVLDNNILNKDIENINKCLYSFITGSFLTRIITLEPDNSAKEYVASSNLFIPYFNLDPYILLSLKNYCKNIILFKNDNVDFNKQIDNQYELINYYNKRFQINIKKDYEKKVEMLTLTKKNLNILFPLDIYTVKELYIIYSKIPEKSVLRNSLSFEILQLYKIDNEKEWNDKWQNKYYYKVIEMLGEISDDELIYYNDGSKNIYEADKTIFNIEYKDKDIWIKLLLRYEFENLLDGTYIKLAFFIHGFFSTYYGISNKIKNKREKILIESLSINKGISINDPKEAISLYEDYENDPINGLDLDELNVLFSGPEEINIKELKELIYIDLSEFNNRSTITVEENTVDYYKQVIFELIDNSNQNIIALVLQYITGFSQFIKGKKITFLINNFVEIYNSANDDDNWDELYDGTDSHTCFSKINLDYRIFRKIDDIKNDLESTRLETDSIDKTKKMKILNWSIKNNIKNTLFNKEWLEKGKNDFNLAGGTYEIINSLSNFNF